MRRWRDQSNTRNRVTHTSDRLVDLVTGQLTALAGLCSLRYLDLQLVSIDEVVSCYAKTSGGDLLHRTPLRITVRKRDEASFVFAALAGVRSAADPVHRNRKCLVRFGTDRAKRHSAGCESLHD